MDHGHLLAAGGILPRKAKVKDAILDVLEARAYEHPALAAPMVRLAPAQVAHGVDLEMELLGFVAPKKGTTLGQVRREKLGFPGWCLVHDAKNARFALDVVKDLKKAARRIKSKPGHAKEGIDAIAKGLAGSVPHFLPSFYEEVARHFLEHDSRKFAQQYFEKARQAEREYALEVDDELREQSFVDFALAGALAVKSLSNFASELTERGEAGLESYLRVCVRRTTGGLPPSPAMLKDLKSLAKAAGKNADEVHVRFLGAILESPALALASAGFFKAAKKPLHLLTKNDAELRAKLLDLFPREVKTDAWMPTLQACGCLAAIVDAEADGQSEMKPAEWFGRALQKGDSPILRELLVKAKPRLVAEAVPVIPGTRWGLNVDVTELCLAHEIPISRGGRAGARNRGQQPRTFRDLSTWAQSAEGADVPHIAARAEWRELMVQECSSVSSYWVRRYEKAVETRPVFAEIFGEGLARRIGRMRSGAMPDLKDNLDYLASIPESMWSRYDFLRETLEGVDVAQSLARTLQIGLFAEWRWPQLDEVQLGGNVGVFDDGSFVTLHDNARAVSFDAHGQKVAEVRPKLETGENIARAIHCQGDILVITRKAGDEMAFWASAPTERAKLTTTWNVPASGHLLEDGSVLVGTARVREGTLPRNLAGNTLFDGERYYARERGTARVLDPLSGELGDEAVPEFLAKEPEGEQEGPALWAGGMRRIVGEPGDALRVAAGGMLGLRFRYIDSKTVIDDLAGHESWVGRYSPRALFWVPGDDTPRVIYAGYRGLEIFADGVMGSDDISEYHRGRTPFFSMSLLRYYRARDAALSAKLRAATRDRVAAIVVAAATPTALAVKEERNKPWVPDPEVVAAIEDALGPVSDATLAACLAGIAHHAGQLERIRAALDEKAPGAKKGASLPTRREIGSARLPHVLGDFAWPFSSGHDVSKPTLLSEVSELRTRFDAPGEDGSHQVIAWGPHIWQLGLGHGAAFMYRYALAPKKDDDARALIAEWARAHVAAGFEGAGRSRIRVAFRKENTLAINEDSYRPTWKVLGQNAIMVWQLGYEEDAWYSFVEHAPDGEFRVITDPGDDIAGPGWASTENIDAVVAHVESHGPLPIEAAVPLLAAATGLSPAEATLWASAELTTNTFERVKSGRVAAQAFFENDPFVQPYPTHMSRTLRMASTLWTTGDWRDLWDPAELAARLASAWKEHHPVLPPLAAIDDATGENVLAASRNLLARVGLPGGEGLMPPSIGRDQDRWFDAKGYHAEGPGFSSADTYIKGFVQTIWDGPANAALFRSVPTLWRALRERLSHPNYFYSTNFGFYFWDGMDADQRAQQLDLLRAYGDDIPEHLWRGPREKPDPQQPAKMPSGDARAVAHFDGRRANRYVHPLRVLEDDASLADYHRDRLRFILGEAGDGYIALAERLAGQEGHAADPRFSAPEVVTEMAKLLGVDEAAATLYLVYAAHAKPKDKVVRDMLGWDKKELAARSRELVAAGHLMEAKRAGAGRSHFLPGAWLKDVEEWKLPLLGRTSGEGSPHPYFRPAPFGPGAAPDVLYGLVLARLQADDRPRFEDPPRRKPKGKK